MARSMYAQLCAVLLALSCASLNAETVSIDSVAPGDNVTVAYDFGNVPFGSKSSVIIDFENSASVDLLNCGTYVPYNPDFKIVAQSCPKWDGDRMPAPGSVVLQSLSRNSCSVTVEFTPSVPSPTSSFFQLYCDDFNNRPEPLTVFINLTADASIQNSAPTIQGTPQSGIYDGDFYNFIPLASDADGDSLSFSILNKPSWATFNPLSGRLSGKPSQADVGVYSNIQLSVSDGKVNATLTPFSITVVDRNYPPVFSTNETIPTAYPDTAYSFQPQVSDEDGDTLTFSITNKPAWATFNPATGEITGTPTNGDIGLYSSIVISAFDGLLTTDRSPLTISVGSEISTPHFTTFPDQSVYQGIAYYYGSTVDGLGAPPLTFSATNLPGWLTLNPVTGELSGTPGPGDVGYYSNIKLSATDSVLTAYLEAFSIQVLAFNQAPSISGIPLVVIDQDQAYSFTPSATDPEGDTLSFSASNLPAWLALNTATGELTGTPTAADVGSYPNIQLSVHDGATVDSLPTFTITVNNVNDAPVITGTPSSTVAQYGIYQFSPGSSDLDGDVLTFSAVNLPGWLSLNTVTGTVSGVPQQGDVGLHSNIQLTVSDGALSSTLPDFSITVSNVNDGPVISGVPPVSVNQDALYSYTVSASDLDGDSLTFSAQNLPVWLTLNPATGLLSGTPNATQIGVYNAIGIDVTDGVLTTSLSPFSITVINVNDAPVISGTPSSAVNQNSGYSFVPTASDIDGDALTFSSLNLPAWLSLNASTGEITGVPAQGDVGVHSNIQLTVSDGALSDTLPAFSITVSDVNDPPVIGGSPPGSVLQNTLYSFTPSSSDLDGNSLTFSAQNLPGWLSINASTGEVSGTPGPSDVATFNNILIEVTDGALTATLANFNITVINVNDAPAISGVPATSVNQDQIYNFTPSATDIDGDLVTFTISNQPGWASFNSSTGQLSGIPGNGDVGSYANVTISAFDGSLSTPLTPFTITVVNVNDPPLLSGIPNATVNQDAAYLFLPVVNDIDGDVLTFSVLNLPGWLSLNASTGEISGTPGNSDVGLYTNIQLSVSDGTATVNLATFSVQVININDAPSISGVPGSSVLQDGVYSFTPVASDIDGDSLTFSIVNQPPWTSFNTVTGQLSGTPGNSDVGIHGAIGISVSDGSLSASLGAFSITVNNVNDAPVIGGLPATVIDQDQAYSFTPSSNDIDGDALTFSIINQPGWLSFNASTGALTGTPGHGDVGTYSNIQLSVSDSVLSASLPAFSITVNNVNDAPTISGVPASAVNQDVSYSFVPGANDIDGDSLSFSPVNLPSWLTLNPTTGEISGTPGNSDVGIHGGISITVSDGSLSSSLGPFTITVNNVNDAPTVSGIPPFNINQNQAYYFAPTGNDIDGDGLTWSAVNLPGWLSLNSATGEISGTPGQPDVGAFSNIQLSASDGSLSASLPTFSITVIDVNDAPTITGVPAASINQDQAYSFTPVSGDVDGDSLSYSGTNLSTWLTVNPTTGELYGTPDATEVGTFSNIQITVSDGSLSASLPPFSITVNNVNDAPVISGSPSPSVNQNLNYSFAPSASDIDGDILTFSAVNLPGWLSLNTSIGTISGVPAQGDVGVHSNIQLTVSDGALSTTLPAFSITVIDVNDGPIISGSPPTTIAQDAPYNFTPTASDPDGDSLSFSMLNRPGWMTANPATGQLTGTPGSSDVLTYNNIILQVSDGSVTSTLPAFSITVTNVNDAPVIGGSPSPSVNQNLNYSFTPSASDIDGDSLTFSAVNLPGWLSINTSTGTISGVPAQGDVGVHSNIQLSVSDGALSATLPAFSITVIDVNDGPIISGSPPTTVAQDAPYNFTPTASDPDGDSLSFSMLNRPGWMTANPATGQLTGTPGSSDVLTYNNIILQVSDGSVTSTLPAFSITVTNVNDAPVISGSPVTAINQNQLYSFTPTASDIDGDSLTFMASNIPSWLAINSSSGELSGTPGQGDIGTHSNIQLSVSDGILFANLPLFSVTVADVNDGPVLGGTPPLSVNQGQPYSFTPTAIDPDGDPISFSVQNMPAWLSFNLSTGQLSGTPFNDDVGVHSNVQIRATDGSITTTLTAFDITVVNVNDVPGISGTPTAIINQNQAYSFTPSSYDIDGDTLTFSGSGLPGWLSVNPTTGELSGTPGQSDVGVHNNIQLTVQDASLSASLAPFSITVVDVNDAPDIGGTPVATVNQAQAYSFIPTVIDVDGDPVTLSVTGLPGWMTFDAVTGELAGTPGQADIGVYNNIQIHGTDGLLSGSTPPFSITVNNVNDAPSITGSPPTIVMQHQAYNTVFSATDVDGDTPTFTATNLPSWLSLDAATGVISGRPDQIDVGVHSNIEIAATDGTASTTHPAFAITVVDVNDPPGISGIPPGAVAQDTAYSFIPVLSDPDGDVLSVSGVNIPAWLTLDTNTGELSGVPANSDIGQYNGIELIVSDGLLTSSLPVFSITVSNTNDAPVISGVPLTSVNQYQAYSFTPIASDIDGDPLMFSASGLPAWLSLNPLTGELSGSPQQVDVGVHSGIQISVSDGIASASLLPFSITVMNVNDVPTISGSPAADINQEQLYTFLPVASDIDGDTLSFTATNLPSWMTLDANSGALTGTPGNDDVGVHSGIQLTVSDGSLSASLPLFTITVHNVNDAPTISGSPSANVDQDQAYQFLPVVEDIDGDSLSFTGTNVPGWLTLNASTGELTGVPANDDVAVWPGIQVSVSDGALSADLPAFAITVHNVNDAPTITGSPQAGVNQDELYQFVPVLDDIDGDSLTVSATGLPGWLTLNPATGAISGTPGNADVGQFTGLDLTVTDGALSASLGAFSIIVNNVNDAPTISGNPITAVNQDETYQFSPIAEDIDGDVLQFSASNLPGWLSLNPQTGQLAGTPGNDEVGLYSNIVLSVSDGTLSAALPAFSLEVVNVNDAPTISGTPETTVNQDEGYSFTPTADDIDGDSLTFSVSGQPDWMVFDSATGELAGVPGNKEVGVYAGIQIQVSDGSLSATLAPFIIEVVNVNDAPEIEGVPVISVLQEQVYQFTPVARDIDGDVLSFSVTNKPDWLLFDSAFGTLSGTPRNEHVGEYPAISIEVSDGVLTAALAPFSITVINVNDAPVISGFPPLVIDQGKLYQFEPIASDPDTDPLTFSVTNLPGWLSFNSTTGRLSGIPVESDIGSHSGIQITVSDGELSAALTPFSVTVNNVNDPPVISANPPTTATQNQLYQFAAIATDVENDPLTFSLGNAPGWLQVSPQNGLVSGIPGPDDVGVFRDIILSVSDGQATASTNPFTITVKNINDPPEISGSPTLMVNQGTLYRFKPEVTDPDNDELRFTVVNKPDWASFDVLTGELTGTPANGDVGMTQPITLSVSDGEYTATLETFVITVIDVNDPPEIGGSPATTVQEGATYQFTPTASDPENDELTFDASGLPGWLTVDADTGRLTGVPENADVGVSSAIVLSVSDGELTAELPTFSITVTNVNDAPEISGEPLLFVNQDEPYVFLPTASDPDGDVLTFIIENKPVWAEFNTNSGELSGVPGNDDVGEAADILISAFDGQLITSLPAFLLTVNNLNDMPGLTGGSVKLVSGSEVFIEFTATDPDGDELTISLVDAPTAGEVIQTEAGWIYRSTAGFEGNDVFTLIASDGELESPPASFTVEVIAVEEMATNDVVVEPPVQDEVYILDTLANDKQETDEQIKIVASLSIHGDTSTDGDVIRFVRNNRQYRYITVNYVIENENGQMAFAQANLIIEEEQP